MLPPIVSPVHTKRLTSTSILVRIQIQTQTQPLSSFFFFFHSSKILVLFFLDYIFSCPFTIVGPGWSWSYCFCRSFSSPAYNLRRPLALCFSAIPVFFPRSDLLQLTEIMTSTTLMTFLLLVAFDNLPECAIKIPGHALTPIDAPLRTFAPSSCSARGITSPNPISWRGIDAPAPGNGEAAIPLPISSVTDNPRVPRPAQGASKWVPPTGITFVSLSSIYR